MFHLVIYDSTGKNSLNLIWMSNLDLTEHKSSWRDSRENIRTRIVLRFFVKIKNLLGTGLELQ